MDKINKKIIIGSFAIGEIVIGIIIIVVAWILTNPPPGASETYLWNLALWNTIFGASMIGLAGVQAALIAMLKD